MAKFTLRAYDVTVSYTHADGTPATQQEMDCFCCFGGEEVTRHENRELIFNESHSRRVVLNNRYDSTVLATMLSGAYKPKGDIQFEWETAK